MTLWNAVKHDEGEEWMRMFPVSPRGVVGLLMFITGTIAYIPFMRLGAEIVLTMPYVVLTAPVLLLSVVGLMLITISLFR